ncbi:protein CROWDED NUCLEI 1 isoform X1 [Dendrobium catenatum]|uniref:protein CROWDED NUCLEI 1 isoform X1 n=1 Tax=Dendrobium catenatum TaxID=906689 RepID=UPI0009F6AF1B|nr:protein CROWDED NUCLEI 1 isoform X1 [Dendrobium catenatum]
MFTPQRKGWAGLGLQENGSVVRANPRSSLGGVLGRGKGVVGAEETPVPPPKGLLGDKDGERADIGVGGSGSEDWKRFRESGLLDEKVQLRRDKEVLTGRVSALEIERDECLYNMGLLLIEKNEWSSQIEELRQALAEAQEILKREEAAHIIAVSELEKREDNLKKALGIEKQCVVDLEKALREMRAEVSETKFISENKLANAHALEASLEEKQLQIESKLHAADARLAEANRKNSELDRKLEDLEARERKAQRELSSLHTERKAFENDLSKQRDHLLEWEKELQEKQRRLLDEQRLLNEREERANDLDLILKKKEVEVEEARKKIDVTSSTLKSQEDDYKVRLRALTMREKGVEIKSSNLEKKEKDLMEVEEKLNAREREEIQKLLDEHNAILDAKKQEFELEMAKKRRSFNEEVKNHMDMLGKDKNIVRCKEEQLLKRENALEIEADELKNKEKDIDSKSKALKEWEDSLKTDEKLLQEQRKQVLKDFNEIEASRAKLHNEKIAIEAEVQKVIFEKENLKLTQEEKEHHLKLQKELKLEKDEYQMMMESLEKQKEALRQEREMFERDWEVLDEKRVALEADLKQLCAEREKLEKWRHTEEERLKHEVLEARASMHRELEDLRLKKETFEKIIAQERAGARADIDSERADLSREFELFKHGLEMTGQRKQDDAEKKFQEKKNEFEMWREVELSRIKSSIESNDLEFRRLEMQQKQLLRDKEQFSDQRRKIEADRQEIQKDIDTLLRLSKNLKDQREEFAKERENFLSAAEQCKTCHNCGVPINNVDQLVLQPLGATVDSEEVLLPSLTDGFLEEHAKGGSPDLSHGGPVAGSANSGSQMKRWFQRCASLFKISPRNNVHSPTEDHNETSFGERLDKVAFEDADYEPAPSASFENQMAHVDSGDVVTGELVRVDNAEDDAEASLDGANSSMDIVKIDSDDGSQKTAAVTDGMNNEVEGSSMHAEKDLKPEPSKQGQRHQPNRRAKSAIRRTRSVKAVVEDAKAILGEVYETMVDEKQNDNAKDSQNIPNENPEASVKADRAVTGKRKKRRLREVEPEDSEPLSESVSIGGRPKRQQTSSRPTTPGEKRYNLRRSTVASSAATSHGTSHQTGATNVGKLELLHESNIVEGGQPVSNKGEGGQQESNIEQASNRTECGQPVSYKVEGSRPVSNEVEGSQQENNIFEDGQPENNITEGGLGSERNSFHDPQPSRWFENSEYVLPKDAVDSAMEVQSEKIVQVTKYKTQEVHDDSIIVKSVKFIEQIQDRKEVDGDNGITVKSTEFIEQIAEDGDEVDGDIDILNNSAEFSEQVAEDGDEVDGDAATATPSDWSSEDEDEYSKKHNASIGKKLWTFFTT